MTAVLDESWELLPERARLALARLSVFEDGSNLDAACAVVSTGDAWPEELIETLWDHSLIQWGQSDDRIALPGMVRDYAAQKLIALGEEDATRQRHLEAMVELARSCAGEDVHDRAVERAAHDRENLIAAFRLACDFGRFSEALLCLRIVWRALDSTGPYELALELAGRLSRLPVPDEESRQWLVWVRAGALWRAGRNEEALEMLDGAIDWRADTEPYSGILMTLGNVQWALGDIGSARSTYERVVAITDSRAERGVARGNLGLVEWNAGNLLESRRHFEASIAIHRERGSAENEGVGLSNLAIIEAEEGNNAEAIRLIKAAIEKHRLVGDVRSEALARTNLSDLLRRGGELEAARRELDNAIAENRRLGNRALVGVGLTMKGNLLLDQGEPREALVVLEQALGYHVEGGHQRYEAITRGHRANALALVGRLKETRQQFHAAIRIVRDVGFPVELARLLCELADFEIGQGEADAARAALEEASAAARDLDQAVAIVRRISELRDRIASEG
jgi:tetratricopeptide (TPR) repeat protein